MRSRKTRLAVIVEILNNNNISCQEELSKQLAVKGIIVTQATLSRDLKKLRTVKVANDLGGYRYIVSNPELDGDGEIRKDKSTIQSPLHPAALKLRISGNIAVIKTRNGYASGLAYDLDSLKSEMILGTIPGADTVFAVIDKKASIDEVFDFFSKFLPPEVVSDARAAFSA